MQHTLTQKKQQQKRNARHTTQERKRKKKSKHIREKHILTQIEKQTQKKQKTLTHPFTTAATARRLQKNSLSP